MRPEVLVAHFHPILYQNFMDFAPLFPVSRWRFVSPAGIAVLAHPSDTGEETLRDLVASGLDGLEVYTPYPHSQEREAFKRFAAQQVSS